MSKDLRASSGIPRTRSPGTLHEALDKAGIEHTFLETGGAHHWRVWRRYLRGVAPLLFKGSTSPR